MTSDRTTWTPLQIATSDYMAAVTARDEALNALQGAEFDVDDAEDAARESLALHGVVVKEATRRVFHANEAFVRAQLTVAETEQLVVTTWKAYWAVNRLNRKEFADRLGIAPDTLSGYVSRGQAPAPDSPPGEGPWWYQATVEEYSSRDKRPGVRTRAKR